MAVSLNLLSWACGVLKAVDHNLLNQAQMDFHLLKASQIPMNHHPNLETEISELFSLTVKLASGSKKLAEN